MESGTQVDVEWVRKISHQKFVSATELENQLYGLDGCESMPTPAIPLACKQLMNVRINWNNGHKHKPFLPTLHLCGEKSQPTSWTEQVDKEKMTRQFGTVIGWHAPDMKKDATRLMTEAKTMAR